MLDETLLVFVVLAWYELVQVVGTRAAAYLAAMLTEHGCRLRRPSGLLLRREAVDVQGHRL